MPAQAAAKRNSRGQSLVEFTLALPIFLIVLLGIAEGGYYIVATTAVSHATNEGARLGVLENTTDLAAIKARVESAASVVLSVADGDITLKLNDVSCDDTCYSGRVSGDRLAVTTVYNHRPLVSYIFSGITFPASASAELTVE